MAIVTTNSQHYEQIAAAIRAKSGSTDTLLPSQMAAAIAALSGATAEGRKLACGLVVRGDNGSGVIDTGLANPATICMFPLNANFRTIGKGILMLNYCVTDNTVGYITIAGANASATSGYATTSGAMIYQYFTLAGGVLTWAPVGQYAANYAIIQDMAWYALE